MQCFLMDKLPIDLLFNADKSNLEYISFNHYCDFYSRFKQCMKTFDEQIRNYGQIKK